MFEAVSNPQIISVLSGQSTAHARVRSRFSHLLIYKESGTSVYTIRDREYLLTEGCVLYVPEHEAYHFRKTSVGDSVYRLVNFRADMGDEPPQLITVTNRDNCSLIFRQMEHAHHLGRGPAEEYETLSLFYRLLALLCQSELPEYTTAKTKALIAPAMEYLEQNLFSCELKMAELHTLCHMSAPTFRHIFLSKTGMTPKKYVIQQRLVRAQNILDSGEYQNIAEVARSVGYSDPLYFSRHFKMFCGVCPTRFVVHRPEE